MKLHSRPSRWLRVTAAFLSVVVLAQPVIADTVMLRSGAQVHGTIANREQYRLPMPRMESVAILTADSTGGSRELRRFAPDSVEAVVIEVDGRTTVYDLHRAATPSPESRASVPTLSRRGISEFKSVERASDGRGRAALAGIVGIAAFTLGVAKKFGGPKVEVTGSGFEAEAHTYNAANYSLMGVGLALSGVGLLLSTSHHAQRSEPAAMRAPGVEERVALQVRF